MNRIIHATRPTILEWREPPQQFNKPLSVIDRPREVHPKEPQPNNHAPKVNRKRKQGRRVAPERTQIQTSRNWVLAQCLSTARAGTAGPGTVAEAKTSGDSRARAKATRQAKRKQKIIYVLYSCPAFGSQLCGFYGTPVCLVLFLLLRFAYYLLFEVP